MKAAATQELEIPQEASQPPLSSDPRWEVANRIANSESFLKSTRLPKLLLYLAQHTISGDRNKLTEQVIGQAVFGKRQYFDPSEDSSVRVNVRQLRLKLHEYYQDPGLDEDMIVSLPKGGYAVDFSLRRAPYETHAAPLTSTLVEHETKNISFNRVLAGASLVLLLAVVVCAIGWHQSISTREATTPWPLSSVLHRGQPTTLVLADASTSLRMLGDQELTLDGYIDHRYLEPILPKHMTDREERLFHYLDSTRITSEADANAAAILSSLAGPLSDYLTIRSARDLNVNDLSHGDFIFLGSKTSNPWVELAESHLNFQVFEDGPLGGRYIVNRHPQAGEQRTYQSSSLGTLASGDDYAVIALVPAKTGNGSWLLFEGIRMEGTNAAASLIKTAAGRSKMESKLKSMTGGKLPRYFEALLRAQSVAGATMEVDIVATRSIQP